MRFYESYSLYLQKCEKYSILAQNCLLLSEVWFRYITPAPTATWTWQSCWCCTGPSSMWPTSGSLHHCTKLPQRANTTSANSCCRYELTRSHTQRIFGYYCDDYNSISICFGLLSLIEFPYVWAFFFTFVIMQTSPPCK